jgi:hypothetical protein
MADDILVESNVGHKSTSGSQRSVEAVSTQVHSSYEHISTNPDNSNEGWSYTSNSTNADFISTGQLDGYSTMESDIYGIGHWALSPDGNWDQGAGDKEDPILGHGAEPSKVKPHIEEAIVFFDNLSLGP